MQPRAMPKKLQHLYFILISFLQLDGCMLSNAGYGVLELSRSEKDLERKW